MRTRLAGLLALALLPGCGGADGTSPSDLGGPGSWQTWVLQDGAEIPVATPAGIGTTAELAERDEIRALQAGLNDSLQRVIEKWDYAPALRWNAIAIERLDTARLKLPGLRDATPVRAARAQALLNIALHDAAIATDYHRARFERRAPWRAEPRIQLLAADDGLPSYPSEHAAAAGAAAVVLSYLFPGDSAGKYDRLAREAADSRILAGVSRRSDVEAGLTLGRAVGNRIVASARQDGSDAAWDGAIPATPSAWRPTPPGRIQPPYDPVAGSWRTWVLTRGDAFRPPAPPALGSDIFVRDLDELRALSTGRTPAQTAQANTWATENPSSLWLGFLIDEIRGRRWPGADAARAFAYLSVATYDGFVAGWDGKYAYWLFRPITADSTLITVYATPPYPSYPSGHATIGRPRPTCSRSCSRTVPPSTATWPRSRPSRGCTAACISASMRCSARSWAGVWGRRSSSGCEAMEVT